MGTKYKLPSIYSITNSMTKLSLKDYITERNRDHREEQREQSINYLLSIVSPIVWLNYH